MPLTIMVNTTKQVQYQFIYIDTSMNDNHHHHHHHHYHHHHHHHHHHQQHHHQLPSIQTLDVLSTKVHLAMANWWLLKLLFRAWKSRSPIPKKIDQKTQKRIPGWPGTNGFGWMNLYETQGWPLGSSKGRHVWSFLRGSGFLGIYNFVSKTF